MNKIIFRDRIFDVTHILDSRFHLPARPQHFAQRCGQAMLRTAMQAGGNDRTGHAYVIPDLPRVARGKIGNPVFFCCLPRHHDSNRVFQAKAGFVLHVAFLILLAVSAVAGFFLYAAYNHGNTARRAHEADQCLLDAQSALEQVKYGLVQAYLSNQVSAPGSLDWFRQWSLAALGSNPVYNIPALGPVNNSAVAVTIAGVNIFTNSGYAEVELIGAAGRTTPYAASRTISEILRVNAAAGGEGRAEPFDYAYLLNNSARLRNNIVINGDIRINGTCRLNQGSIVNGERYSSGQYTANSPLWSVGDYWTKAGPRARPTDPTANNNIAWPMGYVPNKSKNNNVAQWDIPVIDDLDALAESARGRISRGGVDLAVNSYIGPGPDNIAGTADDNCLVLDGTASPITIEGAVVVKGDVIIRGRVSGQGTIYAGRNMHITGNLDYVNPPAWPKPDASPEQTAAANKTKDLLVLGAKGNIVVGNYTAPTWSNRVWGALTDPANISPYGVLASDAALGYDSDNNPANGYQFDGRYFVNEANGGRRLSGIGTNTVPRKYYESSLANSTFSALCDANNVPAINAALFTNHGFIGNLGSSAANGNTTLNGALACHTELNNFYGLLTLNWDIRLSPKSREYVNTAFFASAGATGALAEASSTTIGWKEIH